MTKPPAEPPIRQPIGFWATRAGEAVLARTRGALATIGTTQPQWWILHQLSLHPAGVERSELIDVIGPNDTPASIEDALESASTAGWLRVEGSVVHPTELGTRQFDTASELQRELQNERMQGITEEDFAVSIAVLQKTIENVGGDAWHW
ncbi:hypothetical protein ABH922_000391 [Rhodococcus sp. 27YEA15]|uniref:MarR family winged helix-turn-helix transcriptional regulator n=1 Tax=Rhodococcus sp. 27YEA15 TaxID=3156259 RepID=UPI003C7ECDC7